MSDEVQCWFLVNSQQTGTRRAPPQPDHVHVQNLCLPLCLRATADGRSPTAATHLPCFHSLPAHTAPCWSRRSAWIGGSLSVPLILDMLPILLGPRSAVDLSVLPSHK